MIAQQPASRETPRHSRMWVVWLLFFFFYAGIGIYFNFLNIYYRDGGLSGTQIGVINMVTSLIGVATPVVWGNLADRTGKHRLILTCGAVGTLITTQFVPLAHSFGAFLALGSLVSVLYSGLGPLLDGTTLAMLSDRREDYGRYRVGGSIGYVIATLSAGAMFDWLGLRMMFPLFGVVLGIFALTALLLPAIPVRSEARSTGAIGKMMRQPAWVLLAVVVFLVWVAYNAAISFLGVSLKAIGASQSLISVAIVIGAVIEIPFMFYSGPLLRRFGPVRLLLVAMMLMITRYILLGMIPSPAWAIPINILNGPAYAFFWNSAVTYANKLAPSGLSGTAQGTLNSVVGIAGVVSSILTGVLFDVVGPMRLFTVMAFCCMAALVIFAVGQLRTRPSVNNEVVEVEEEE